MSGRWQQMLAQQDANFHQVRRRAANGHDVAHLDSLLENGRVAEEIRRLERLGQAGQEAGPPGQGPEPRLVHQPGADLLNQVQHPAFTTVEHLFRVLPEGSWFSPTVNPRKPRQFNLGTFQVPEKQIFLVFDYEFTPLRLSGVDPFDFVAAENRRFTGVMGFDINLGNSRRPSNLSMQLDPAPTSLTGQSFKSPALTSQRATQSEFDSAAANSFGSVAGQGKTLLPVRPEVQGPRGAPFTMIAASGTNVVLNGVIFRRLTTPLGAIEARVAGYQINQTAMQSLLQRVRPR